MKSKMIEYGLRYTKSAGKVSRTTSEILGCDQETRCALSAITTMQLMPTMFQTNHKK